MNDSINDSSFHASGAKAQDLQVPNSAATPIIIEMNYLRNHSDIVRAKLEAQAALAKERANHVQLKLQMKQQKTLTDNLQGRIETLLSEKTNLQSNKSTLGKADFQPVFGGKQFSTYHGLNGQTFSLKGTHAVNLYN